MPSLRGYAMLALDRILVAYDFLKPSKQAAAFAVHFARKRAEIHQLTVDVIPLDTPEQSLWRTEIEVALERASTHVHAEKRRQGQSGLIPILLGSVAENVITTASCPVLSAKNFELHLTQKRAR